MLLTNFSWKRAQLTKLDKYAVLPLSIEARPRTRPRRLWSCKEGQYQPRDKPRISARLGWRCKDRGRARLAWAARSPPDTGWERRSSLDWRVL